MNNEQLKRKALHILRPLKSWSHNCHAASYKLVQEGIGTRVARGTCRGVGGQHSWVVVGDCYRPDLIIDPTLWSYNNKVKGIFIGEPSTHNHHPHGLGSIWKWGKPVAGDGPTIQLASYSHLSAYAKEFLKLVGPLDYVGWSRLANAPVDGWPCGEILAAMDDTPKLAAVVPIDRLGMLTNRNPGNLYLPTSSKAQQSG
jgi:hypothetical protein